MEGGGTAQPDHRGRIRLAHHRRVGTPSAFSFFVQHSSFRIHHLIQNVWKCPEMSGNVRFPPGVSPDKRAGERFISEILLV
jgi:hypothetical protein